MITLTKRQAQILRFIAKYSQNEGFPPTRQEIADHFGFTSVNAAHEHLIAIQKKGRIEIVPGIARGIRILEI